MKMKRVLLLLGLVAAFACGGSETGDERNGTGGTAGIGGTGGAGGTAGAGGMAETGGTAGDGGTGGFGGNGTAGVGGMSPPVNPCEPNPCQNFGVCETDFDEETNTYSDAVCVCTEDFSGDQCESGPPNQLFACVPNASGGAFSNVTISELYENGGPLDSGSTVPGFMQIPADALDFSVESVVRVELCNLERTFEVGGRLYDGQGELVWNDWAPGAPNWEHLDRGIACVQNVIGYGELAYDATTCDSGLGMPGWYAGQERCLTVWDANGSIATLANYWFARENGDLFTFCNSRTSIDYHDVAIDDYRNSVSSTVRVTFGNPGN
jgi:hypothetical protein